MFFWFTSRSLLLFFDCLITRLSSLSFKCWQCFFWFCLTGYLFIRAALPCPLLCCFMDLFRESGFDWPLKSYIVSLTCWNWSSARQCKDKWGKESTRNSVLIAKWNYWKSLQSCPDWKKDTVITALDRVWILFFFSQIQNGGDVFFCLSDFPVISQLLCLFSCFWVWISAANVPARLSHIFCRT